MELGWILGVPSCLQHEVEEPFCWNAGGGSQPLSREDLGLCEAHTRSPQSACMPLKTPSLAVSSFSSLCFLFSPLVLLSLFPLSLSGKLSSFLLLLFFTLLHCFYSAFSLPSPVSHLASLLSFLFLSLSFPVSPFHILSQAVCSFSFPFS